MKITVNQVYIYILKKIELCSLGGSDNDNHSKPNLHIHILQMKLQSNFNGSNTFGTMKICSRQG